MVGLKNGLYKIRSQRGVCVQKMSFVEIWSVVIQHWPRTRYEDFERDQRSRTGKDFF